MDKRAVAARISGAIPEVWSQIHEAHAERRIATITTQHGPPVTGAITGIDNDGFTITVGVGRLTLPWREALNVEIGERQP